MRTNRIGTTSTFGVQGSVFDVRLHGPSILHPAPSILALLLLLLASASPALATVRYVWQSSPDPAPPYTNWANAAATIQDAVDAAAAGDEIVVTNGTYDPVEVDKPLALRSVDGPQATVIDGGNTVGCLYLTAGATLFGFTLTNGVACNGGGVYCESTSAVLSNCVLVGNSAYDSGGGACQGTLNNCTLTLNSAGWQGGGASDCTLNNCTLSGNSADVRGGGARGSTLNNCSLTGNSAAGWGGGAADGSLINCTLTGNSAGWQGGGASGTPFDSFCGLSNCIVYFNTARVGANYAPATYLNYCCTTPLPVSWPWQGVGNISLDPQLASASHLSAGSPCRGAGSADYVTGTDIDGEPWASPPSIGCDEYHPGAITGPLRVSIAVAYTNVAVDFDLDFTGLVEGRTTASAWDFWGGVVVSNRPYATHAWTAPGDYAVVLWAYNESHPAGVSATVTIHVVAPPEHYIAAVSTNPLPPYTTWATAATNIQDAVDAATVPGTLVLVSNGIYATGGRPVGTNVLVNRVAVAKPLTVRSVNGPQFTTIQGYQVPGATNGDGAIRCVYLTEGASLSGFTLTGGATRTDGDYDREQSGGGVWCESTSAVVSNCVIAGNSANVGGGAAGGTLNNCTLSGNWANGGGGAAGGTLNNCTLTGNWAIGGGGADTCTLNNCTLTLNSAKAEDDYTYLCYGGGAVNCTLNNSTLTRNWSQVGGGASYSTLYNCIVYFNTAGVGANYDSSDALNYCCTLPQPAGGTGNISLDPQLASASHLSVFSPCHGAGSAAYAIGTDIDGEPWGSPPSIGCDECHAGAVTGPLSVGISAAYTNVPVGFPVGLTAMVEGRTTMSIWEFGDGGVALDRPYETHAWAEPGDYVVALWAFNDSHPEGVSATVTVHVVVQPVHCVAAGSSNPVPPYTSWTTAATNIQDAVDAAIPGALVLVTNGVYATGGRAVGAYVLANRVAVDKPLTLRSVNGPQFTVIQGYQVPGTTNDDGAIRCVYLTSGASLSGFTLTNGATRPAWSEYWGPETSGGGVWCESAGAVVSNCVMAGNSAGFGGGASGGTLNNCTLTRNSARESGGGASACTLNNCTLSGNSANSGGGAYAATLNNCALTGNSAYEGGGASSFMGESTLTDCSLTSNSAVSGGGASGCTLINCTLTGNSAGGWGGGAADGSLNNCTLTGNSAIEGGGAYDSTLNNSIVYRNTATQGANYYQDQYGGVIAYCCTTPMPTNGVGNITNAPLFVDYAGGNLRLQSNSPCINAGNNAYAAGPTDLDGNPRVVSGTVDIGAYEFQGPGSTISYAWLQQYGLPIDGSADFTDPDRDGHNNWQEWRCGTCPTNALSALRLLAVSPTGTNLSVTWQSVAGVSYFLERSTNLSATPPFTLLATNVPGQPGTTSYPDTTATNAGPYFYRVGVGN